MKTYWRSGGIAPRIINLGTRWSSEAIFTLRPLYLWGKTPRCPLDKRLDGSGRKRFIKSD